MKDYKIENKQIVFLNGVKGGIVLYFKERIL